MYATGSTSSLLSNVTISEPEVGQVLTYDSLYFGAAHGWVNKAIGITPTPPARPDLLGTVYGLSDSIATPAALGYLAGGDSDAIEQLGGSNTFIGHGAGFNIGPDSENNTYMGQDAGYVAEAQTCSNGTFIGQASGQNMVGNDNIALGAAAGLYSTPTSVNNCIFIGNTSSSEEPIDNAIVLGSGVHDLQSNEMVVAPYIETIRSKGLAAEETDDLFYNDTSNYDRVIYRSLTSGPDETVGYINRSRANIFLLADLVVQTYAAGSRSLRVRIPYVPEYNFARGVTLTYVNVTGSTADPRITVNEPGMWLFTIYAESSNQSNNVGFFVQNTTGGIAGRYAAARRWENPSVASGGLISGTGGAFIEAGTVLQFVINGSVSGAVAWRIMGVRLYP